MCASRGTCTTAGWVLDLAWSNGTTTIQRPIFGQRQLINKNVRAGSSESLLSHEDLRPRMSVLVACCVMLVENRSLYVLLTKSLRHVALLSGAHEVRDFSDKYGDGKQY